MRTTDTSLQELSWVDHHLEKLTLKLMLIILIVILSLIAWNRGVAFLYAVNALLLSTVTISWLLPKLGLKGISIKRKVDACAYEGDTVTLEYDLTQKGFFSRYLIEIVDVLPFRYPSENVFLIPKLKRLLHLKYDLTCDTRGLHTLNSLTLRTGFPLNVFVSQKQFDLPQERMVVYPKALDVKKFTIQSDATNRQFGMQAIEKKGGQDEFIGVREYRHGDSVRKIHWSASAKRREWIVKEFEDVSTQSLTIILDMQQQANVGENKHATFEYAVKIAVSLALYALENSIALNIYGYGKGKLELINIQGMHNVQTILETFAYVQSDGQRPYTEVIEGFLAQKRHGGTLILFENDFAIRHLLPKIEQHHYATALFSFDAGSFTKAPNTSTKAKVTNKRRRKIYQISNGCDLEEMFQ